MCPLSLASATSPCMDANCQKYKSPAERCACRQVATTYCSTSCPTKTMTRKDGTEVTVPLDMDKCMDSGCIQMGNLESRNSSSCSAMLNTDPNASATGEAP